MPQRRNKEFENARRYSRRLKKRLKSFPKPPGSCKPSSDSTHDSAESIYHDLSLNKKAFRLLQPLPTEDDDSMFECSMTTHSLDASPDYTALSYVWGNEKDTRTIIINGVKVEVTANLECALKRVRKRNVSHVWADAVCINQADAVEKAQQIGMMRDIFCTASCVYASIINDNGSEDLALKWIAMVSLEHMESQDRGQTENKMFERYPELDPGAHKSLLQNRIWVALVKLFSNDHWHRVWIFQETVLAKRLFLLGHDMTVNADLILRFYHWLEQLDTFIDPVSRKFISGVSNMGAWWMLRSRSVYSNTKGDTRSKISELRLRWCIDASFGMTSTEPRDMVYGITGILDINFDVDYEKPAGTVYAEFAQWYLTTFRRLDFDGTGLAFNSNTKFDLPSWLPNWHADSQSEIYSVTTVADEGLAAVEARQTPTRIAGHILEISGVRCDKVARVQLVRDGEAMIALISNHVSSSDQSDLVEWTLWLLKLFHIFDCFGTPEKTTRGNICSRIVPLITNFMMSNMPELDENHTERLSERLRDGLDALNVPKLDQPDDSQAEEQYLTASISLYETFYFPRVLFHTTCGHMGVGHVGTSPGDIISVLDGFNYPMILRKTGAKLAIVGRSFVVEYAYGQAAQMVAAGEAKCEKLIIQ